MEIYGYGKGSLSLAAEDAVRRWILEHESALQEVKIPEDAYPIVYARSALGIIFVLFLPGYTMATTPPPKPIEELNTTTENADKTEQTKNETTS